MVGSILTLIGCVCAAPSTGGTPPAAPYAPHPPVPAGVLLGACEASTILPWNGGWLVGDNEDSRRLYAYDLDFAPRGTIQLPAEVDDIESMALGGAGYWVVGSHSTNKDGERRPLRERILAPDGSPRQLALAACPPCVAARGLAPNAGGFNIEGAAWWSDRLWVGLRAPLSASGKAYLLEVDGTATVASVMELDLDGLGVREMIPYDGGLLILAGPTADAKVEHHLYGLDATRLLTHLPVRLPASTEGIALDPARPGTLVYVTDGDGKPGTCKQPATWGRVTIGE